MTSIQIECSLLVCASPLLMLESGFKTSITSLLYLLYALRIVCYYVFNYRLLKIIISF